MPSTNWRMSPLVRHVLLQDELPNGAAGLHKRDDNKQPFALVALTTN